jgi:hypothetical protein
MNVVLCRHADPQLACRRRRDTLGPGVSLQGHPIVAAYYLSLGRPPSGEALFFSGHLPERGAVGYRWRADKQKTKGRFAMLGMLAAVIAFLGMSAAVVLLAPIFYDPERIYDHE